MKWTFLATVVLLSLTGCGNRDEAEPGSLLQGVWTARRGEFPLGDTWDYPTEEGFMFCRVFDGDSMTYKCRLSAAGTNLVMIPLERCDVTLIDKGHGEVLYLEDGDPHPLTIVNDSTIIIQMNGVRNTWVRDDRLTQEWGTEMRDIMAKETEAKVQPEAHHYVLSRKEREQETTIHGLVVLVIGIVFTLIILTQKIVASQRSKRRLQEQLRQIQEENETRPQLVRQAMKEVEEAFFASDEYAALQRRIGHGATMEEADWDEVERLLKHVYPDFIGKLRSLHRMSELEYRVCLLTKLRIATRDIAGALCRDASTISTVRSRLYQKVFGRKGGAREWDEFILSIGA